MEFTTFDPANFRDELEAAGDNRNIGTAVQFENERVRVWDITLDPGDRLPFHGHTNEYFFTCVEPGRCVSRFPDGNQVTMDYRDGETWYSERGEEPEIHDLENVGDTRIRFVTVELL